MRRYVVAIVSDELEDGKKSLMQEVKRPTENSNGLKKKGFLKL